MSQPQPHHQPKKNPKFYDYTNTNITIALTFKHIYDYSDYSCSKYILCKAFSTNPLSISDKLKQRLAEIEAKIKETRGQKIANQYIVVLKSDLSSSKAQALANDAKDKHGAKLLQVYQKAIKGFTVSVPNQQALEAILNSSDVAYAEPDVKVKTFAQGGDSKTRYFQQELTE